MRATCFKVQTLSSIYIHIWGKRLYLMYIVCMYLTTYNSIVARQQVKSYLYFIYNVDIILCVSYYLLIFAHKI